MTPPAPVSVPEPGLPEAVRVYEVAPRDGLQAEPDLIGTDVKVELCRRLYAAGVRELELTSFVPPSWIPQLADADVVMAEVEIPADARGIALVPNLRGLERAIGAGARDVSVVVSASESFARANLNASREVALRRAVEVVREARAAGIGVRGYVSMAFGDPWEGAVEPDAVAEAAEALASAGCGVVALGDTIGVATPGQTRALVERVVRQGVPVDRLALHLHDTYGQGLANVHAGLQAGVAEFDASAGGLGRCPYAKGATGNLATEDLVWMLHGLGIRTGIDLAGLAATTAWLAHVRGAAAPSRVATALAAAGIDETTARTIKETPRP